MGNKQSLRTQQRLAGEFYPPDSLRAIWHNPLSRDACVSLGKLVAHGGWQCDCAGSRSAAQLECSYCGKVRPGAALAIGLPVVAGVTSSAPEFQGFQSVYVEARVGDAIASVGVPLPSDACEGLIFALKMVAVTRALRAAHREWRERHLTGC